MRVSIRVVLIAMMVVLAVVSSLIIGTLIYDAGVRSVHNGVNLLRTELVNRKQLEIRNFFQAPMTSLLNLQAASRIQGTFNYKNPDTLDYWLCSMLRINKYLPTYFGTEDGVYGEALPGDNGQCAVWKRDTVGDSYEAVMDFTADDVPVYVTPARTPLGFDPFDPRTRPWYNRSRFRPGYSNAYLNYDTPETAVTPGAPFFDPAQGRNVGVFATDFLTTDLIKYLSSVKVAKTGKMIVVERATRNVIGSSWDEPAVLNVTVHNAGDYKNETATVYAMARLDNYSEPLLKSAVSALGMDTLYDCNDTPSAPGGAVSCRREIGRGRDRVFLDIVGIRDEFGLDLRLIVLIPEADFLDEMWSRSDTAIGAAVGSVAGLILIATGIVYLVLLPLQRVEERLYQTATLEDKDDDDVPSMFTEVCRIQEAYAKMVAELKRIRSYVPQSLLRTLDNVVGDENDEESESPGDQLSGGGANGSDSQGDRERRSRTKRTPSEGDKSHRSKRSSNHSTASKVALAAGRHLNTSCGLATRRCSVVVVNLANFHQLAKSVTVDSLLNKHSDVMTIINTIVKAQKGVFDSLLGDHFTLTFNAVTAVASHVTRAASSVLQIAAKIPTANFGVATGQVLCGNVGIDEIKRFSIIGPTANQAAALERLCKLLGVRSLVSYSCFEGMQFEFHLECVDIAILPFTKAPTPIATLISSKGVGSSAAEWMYDLQKSTNESSFTDINEAFLRAAQGDAEGAREAIEKAPQDMASVRRLREIVSAPLDEYVKRLGPFYTVCHNGAA